MSFSTPVGLKGLKRIGTDPLFKMSKITFAAAASAIKILRLQADKSYSVMAMGAGPSTVTVEATSDTADAIANGTAKYAPVKTYTAMAAAGGFLGFASGYTALKITHVKSGAGTDDAPTVATLGGRFQVRAIEVVSPQTPGFGAYTALTAT